MHDFPFPQETDYIADIRVVGQAENIIIGEPGFLLRSHILRQIGDNIARNLRGGGGPGIAGGKLGEDAGGVVYKIRVESSRFNLLLIQVARKLMDQRSNHLQMPQFLCTYQGVKR